MVVSVCFVFFKQKTAYEVRISDWSSDVCSSDLVSQDHGLQTQIYIRGIGSNLQGIATGNSVSTYVDGVYIPNSIQSAQGFTDIERIEILKGPQATLYGRNATGGAIIIVSSDPEFEYGGAARSEEHTSELQSLMRISYAVFCLKKKNH